jgi:hypothetical protein
VRRSHSKRMRSTKKNNDRDCYSSSRASVRNRLLSFQRCPNLHALLSTQRRELKSVLCSQCTNNFRRDHLFVGLRQGDFERHRLAQCQSLGHESITLNTGSRA